MKAIIFALLAGVCWGVGELCTRSVLHGRQVGPMGVLLVRITIAMVPAAIVFYLTAVKWQTEPLAIWRVDGPTMVKLLLGSGLLAGFGGVLFFYLALSAGEIGVVKPIAFTVAPALAVVLGWLLLGEMMSVRKAAGLACVVVGIVLLCVSPQAPNVNQPGDVQATPVP